VICLLDALAYIWQCVVNFGASHELHEYGQGEVSSKPSGPNGFALPVFTFRKVLVEVARRGGLRRMVACD
jgi:hypothetical protein